MATNLVAKLDATLSWTYRNIESGSSRTVTDANSVGLVQSLENGTLINEADIIYRTQATVNDAASTDIDLAGSLSDAFGNTITFSLIKGIWIRNRNTTAAENLDVGGGSATFDSWLGATGDVVTIGPNGLFVLWNPSLAGYAVTATTADILRLTGEGGNITYDLVLLGVSA